MLQASVTPCRQPAGFWHLLGTAVSNTSVPEDGCAESWQAEKHIAMTDWCSGVHTAKCSAQGSLLSVRGATWGYISR